jgi:hypothetical protein
VVDYQSYRGSQVKPEQSLLQKYRRGPEVKRYDESATAWPCLVQMGNDFIRHSGVCLLAISITRLDLKIQKAAFTSMFLLPILHSSSFVQSSVFYFFHFYLHISNYIPPNFFAHIFLSSVKFIAQFSRAPKLSLSVHHPVSFHNPSKLPRNSSSSHYVRPASHRKR